MAYMAHPNKTWPFGIMRRHFGKAICGISGSGVETDVREEIKEFILAWIRLEAHAPPSSPWRNLGQPLRAKRSQGLKILL